LIQHWPKAKNFARQHVHLLSTVASPKQLLGVPSAAELFKHSRGCACSANERSYEKAQNQGQQAEEPAE
jgi:hypothetical protein